MDFFRKIWNKIKEPKAIFLIPFYILFFAIVALTIVMVVKLPQQGILHYILYPIASIMLTYFVYTIVYFAPKAKQSITNLLRKNKFTNAMLDSYGYRTIMFSILSFVLNMTFVVFQGILAIMTGSAWYISITIYYLVLSLVKGTVFYNKKKFGNSDIQQAKTYRYCGIMFILMTLAFSGIITLIYTTNMYFEYAGLIIYAAAAYTFYKLALAIYNIFKARQLSDLYIQSIRNINLASALISIVVLQVAMFQAFSPENNTSIANGITGAIMSLIILCLGTFMIIKSNKKLNSIKETNDEKQQ